MMVVPSIDPTSKVNVSLCRQLMKEGRSRRR